MAQVTGKLGISAALLTPFAASGEIDTRRLGEHAKSVLAAGADGVTLFGTTGEGASIGEDERLTGLEAILAAECPAERVNLGVCATSFLDAARQVSQGLARGVTRFLVLPPFYFKGIDDAGLFEWHDALVRRTPQEAAFVLYHIPQVSGVALSVDLVRRLAAAAPDRIVAIKDSSGDWNTAQAFLSGQPVPVLVGDERLLHRAAAHGGAGSISGMANLHPDRLKRVFEGGVEDAALSREVDRIVAQPVIAALKARLADKTGDPAWERLRPPLTPLSPEQRAALHRAPAAASHA